eukprot:Opistho-2@75848
MASAAVLNPAAVMRRLSTTLASEENFLPRANYVNRVQRGEVRESMRDDVVEWLLKLNEQFEYSAETFFSRRKLSRPLSVDREGAAEALAAHCHMLLSHCRQSPRGV